MFRRRPSKDDLYREQIAALNEQIEWLRAQLGLPTRALVLPKPGVLPDGEPAAVGEATWETEYDEAKAILDKQGLSQVHLSEILDGLGVGSSDLS